MSKNYSAWLLFCAIFFPYNSFAESSGKTAFLSYSWLDSVVNKTVVESSSCPIIKTDIYGAGFKVALQTSFYGSASASGSKWFPVHELWTSVGIGPIYNRFGIFFSEINKLEELKTQKAKRIPDSFEEINKWKINDSAYWESQGGVSLYIGAGIAPVDVGVFAVATGGWASFLQKTGPKRVYVELLKKNINSISFGVGVIRPNVSIEKAFDNAQGFAFEFVLDNEASIKAFERFMAGDMTAAQELSRVFKSGVNKISDLNQRRESVAKSFGMATPFLPILSFKASSETSLEQADENSVWDEISTKDTGVYVLQKNFTLFNHQIKESRSFSGGKTANDSKSPKGPVFNEVHFGHFKYAYRSNWGQEKRLRSYVNKVRSLTGLTEETCVKIPAFEDSLGFNQVVLEVKWADSYIAELMGLNGQSDLLLKIKEHALSLGANQSNNNQGEIENIFENLEKYLIAMKSSFKSDKEAFAKTFARFGKEIWRSPFVFKAFYEKGKACGQEFKFEVSGQRLTRHLIERKYNQTHDCQL